VLITIPNFAGSVLAAGTQDQTSQGLVGGQGRHFNAITAARSHTADVLKKGSDIALLLARMPPSKNTCLKKNPACNATDFFSKEKSHSAIMQVNIAQGNATGRRHADGIVVGLLVIYANAVGGLLSAGAFAK